MILTLKPNISCKDKIDSIIKSLNTLKNVTAIGTLINGIPDLITIEIPDNLTPQEIFQIGVLIGAMLLTAI